MFGWLRRSLGLRPKIDLRAFNLALPPTDPPDDPTRPLNWSDLTPREQQAATLLARGLSFDEMYEEMRRSRPAVHYYVSRAMNKSGATNLAELKDWVQHNKPA